MHDIIGSGVESRFRFTGMFGFAGLVSGYRFRLQV